MPYEDVQVQKATQRIIEIYMHLRTVVSTLIRTRWYVENSSFPLNESMHTPCFHFGFSFFVVVFRLFVCFVTVQILLLVDFSIPPYLFSFFAFSPFPVW